MVVWVRYRSQVRDQELDIFECGLLVLIKVKAQPAGSKAAVAVRLLPGDQRRQLEGFGDRHAADLSSSHLGEYEVVAFERPAEDRSRVALRGRRRSSPGPERRQEFTRPRFTWAQLSLVSHDRLTPALARLPPVGR
jgi:hypothetical protein